MQTKTLIQASANVVHITRLSKGDVVKLIEESSYSSAEVFYGVVIDLLNNGDKTYVQIMRYKKSYSSIDCDIKTYSGDKDCLIFPASVEEVEEHLKDVIGSIERDVQSEERKLLDKKLALVRAKDFISGEATKKLISTEFKEMTQQEFAQLKAGGQ